MIVYFLFQIHFRFCKNKQSEDGNVSIDSILVVMKKTGTVKEQIIQILFLLEKIYFMKTNFPNETNNFLENPSTISKTKIH